MAAVQDEEDMNTTENKDESTAIKKRVESLAFVRETVQKKTFTRWANMGLHSEDQISDLFVEFKSGATLIKLINILSGSTMQPERGKMEIHHRSNIGKALNELTRVDPQHGISISAVYEGVPKLTLALVWHLILRYSHLHDMKGVSAEVHCKNWCGSNTEGYPGLENIQKDFLGTWITGLVLPAIINRNNPELLDYADLYHNKSPEQRFEIAFGAVENYYNVPRLLDVEDMNRAHVDDQSVITYLVSINKVLPEKVPEQPPPEIAELTEQILKAEAGLEEEYLLSDESLTEDELTPVECGVIPQILAERESSVSVTPEQRESSVTPEQKGRAEDKDSGLEESPDQHSEEAESFHLGGPGLVPGDQDSHQDSPLDSRLGSTITLDSEAEFVSATSSPVMGVRKLNGDFDLANYVVGTVTPRVDTSDVQQVNETRRQPVAELETALEYITAMPEIVNVSLENMEELKLILAEKGEDCTDIQKQINNQLNWKQERDKRADLHKLLTQTGKFENALLGATQELETFTASLEEFDRAVSRCQEFALQAEQFLSPEEDVIPISAEETERKLSEQKELLNTLVEEQRRLEFSHRALTRSTPEMIPLSLHEQQKTVILVQNNLSDVEGVLNGSVEALSFLSTRLPSLENKLTDVNHILTKAEDDINRVETCNLEDLQLQIDRANNHLATVENLFSAIDSFSAEFNVEVLQEEWVELTYRAARCGDMIEDLVVEEEALSKEVVEISDWAETLENFLQRKMKPIETRDQLRDVQGKWKDVAEDLKMKCEEIEELLHSDYSTQDHRVMSPLDKNALFSLKNQLSSLKGQLQTRRELLQEAYSNWGNVESQIKALSANMSELQFRPSNPMVLPGGSWFRGSWSVRPVLRRIDDLSEGEVELYEQTEQLQCLVENIGDLPSVIVETSHIEKEKESLLNKHAVFCKRASNKRVKLQGAVLKLGPVLPFLRPVHLDKIRWLYNQPLPDLESKRDYSTSQIALQLNSSDSSGNVRYSQYWHIVKTVAPEKIPFWILHLVAFAVGPWGMGCSTDRPMMISFYTPDIKI